MKTSRIILCTILWLLTPALPVYSQPSFGSSEKINGNWSFYLGDSQDAQNKDFDTGKWRKLDLPHDWSVEGTLSPSLASCTGYLPGGIGWYRKTVNIPESKKGERVYLYFEGVYNRSEVFINGVSLGKRPNGYVSFMYDATPHVEYGKDNVIAVRVDHSRSADSRWYTGSGIYRDVWLVYAHPVHISQWGVYAYPEVSKGKGTLHVEVEIDNHTPANSNLTVVNELFSPEGKQVAKDSRKLTAAPGKQNTLSSTLKVNNPALWDIDKPVLYRLKTTILKDGKEIDQTITTTGFRTFTFDPDRGFALNGQWMKMKGVCLHHDAGVLGSAVPREVWKRRLITLKDIGCNAIRTSHNPQAPDLYGLCDELGLLVMDETFDEWEFPKRKWLEGWNVGTPGFEGAYDFFEEWGEQDLADMIKRDRNHISIFAWSIGNEVDYPNDPYSHPVLDGKRGEDGFTQPIFGGYKKDAPDAMRLGGIARRLAAVVKKYDRSRPVTAGLAGVAMSNETEYPSALDIAGYNYTESRYEIDHKTYPDRVIYGSENGHGMSAWKAVRDQEYIFGQFLWTGIDYLGESGRWPSRGFYSGLMDFGGFIKPRGYFRKALWSDQPVVYIGTYPAPQNPQRQSLSMDAWPVWNYEDGQDIRVVCYTNCEQAKLLLNGREAGEIKNYDDQTGIIAWDIPYRAGKLEVVGLKGGKETCRYEVATSGRPEALTVKVDKPNPGKDKNVVHVTVQVVDAHGIPVILSDDEITCKIEGPARLLGLEAGNNRDMGDYTDNVQRAFHGHLLAYIRTTGEAGTVKISFTAPWLKPVETVLTVND